MLELVVVVAAAAVTVDVDGLVVEHGFRVA